MNDQSFGFGRSDNRASLFTVASSGDSSIDSTFKMSTARNIMASATFDSDRISHLVRKNPFGQVAGDLGDQDHSPKGCDLNMNAIEVREDMEWKQGCETDCEVRECEGHIQKSATVVRAMNPLQMMIQSASDSGDSSEGSATKRILKTRVELA